MNLIDVSIMTNEELLALKYQLEKKQNKFAMHLIRLMMEGSMLLATGELEFPFESGLREILMQIRSGERTIEGVLKLAETYEMFIETINSPLPVKPRYDEIEAYVIQTIKRFLK